MKIRWPSKPKFSWRLWSFCGPDENLFDLNDEQQAYFELFVKEARS